MTTASADNGRAVPAADIEPRAHPHPPMAALRGIATTLAFVQLWGARNLVVADSISYLEIGEAYLRGDWSNALNAYWSPAYSLVLGAVAAVLRPSPQWEFTVLHVANFLIFLLAMLAFEFFFRNALVAISGARRARHDRFVWIFGYTVFLWATLGMFGVAYATPDLMLTAILFVAAGLVMKPALPAARGRPFVVGLVLGAGYLTKAAILPVAVTGLLVVILIGRARRPALRDAALAAVGIALIAGPFIAALTMQKQRFTFGESGKLVYAWFVDATIPMSHWQGHPPGSGAPTHPTRQVLASPDVFEFATPIAGTYPVWYDPSYWYDGVETTVRPGPQVQAVLDAWDAYYGLFAPLLVGLLILALIASRRRWHTTRLRRGSIIMLPALAALAMYMLVIVETRYVAPFAAVAGLTAIALWYGSSGHRRSDVAVAVAVSLVLGVSMLRGQLQFVTPIVADIRAGFPPPPPFRLARALREAGVESGEPVAQMARSHEYSLGPYWARLARVRVVAEIAAYPDQWAWDSDSERRREVLDAVRATGARAIVADLDGAPGSLGPDWRVLPETGYAVLLLDER